MTAAVVFIAAVSCNKVLTPLIPEETEVNGDCFVGSLKVWNYAPMEGAYLYVGDVDEGKGTCTFFLPAYDKEGKTMPMLAVRNVTMQRKGDQVVYHHAKMEFTVGGTVYHFPEGLTATRTTAADGTVTLTVNYGIKPGRMPFALDHCFKGKLQVEY